MTGLVCGIVSAAPRRNAATRFLGMRPLQRRGRHPARRWRSPRLRAARPLSERQSPTSSRSPPTPVMLGAAMTRIEPTVTMAMGQRFVAAGSVLADCRVLDGEERAGLFTPVGAGSLFPGRDFDLKRSPQLSKQVTRREARDQTGLQQDLSRPRHHAMSEPLHRSLPTGQGKTNQLEDIEASVRPTVIRHRLRPPARFPWVVTQVEAEIFTSTSMVSAPGVPVTAIVTPDHRPSGRLSAGVVVLPIVVLEAKG